MATDYREIAAIAKQRRADALSKEPLLDDEIVKAAPKNVTRLSQDLSIFSQDQIEIINSEAEDLLLKIRQQIWTSMEVTEAFCKSAVYAQQLTNCVTETLFTPARARARQLDEHLASTGEPVGPLHGLPISLKDCFVTPPHPSSIGMAANANVETTADQESLLAAMLRSLGAVIYVKTNTPPAMMMMETDNNVWGPTVNPHHRGLSAGGSSGGESALIAFRGSPLGIGTDIGGSVRIPSAWCGLYGLRPSFGRFPTFGTRSGIAGQEFITSVNGPMARSLETLSLYSSAVLSHAAAPWTLDPKCVPIPWKTQPQIQPPGRKLRFAIVENYDGYVTAHPPVERALEMTRKVIEAAGHEVVSWDTSLHLQAYMALGAAFLDYGGSAIMPLLEAHNEPVFASMEGYAAAYEAAKSSGTGLTPDQQRANNLAKWKLQKAFLNQWMEAGIDGIIMAVSPWAAARAGCTYTGKNKQAVSYTAWVNVMDLPACTFPVTYADEKVDAARAGFIGLNELDQTIQDDYDASFYDGAPVGLQLVGERLQEEKVLEMVEVVRDCLVAVDGVRR